MNTRSIHWKQKKSKTKGWRIGFVPFELQMFVTRPFSVRSSMKISEYNERTKERKLFISFLKIELTGWSFLLVSSTSIMEVWRDVFDVFQQIFSIISYWKVANESNIRLDRRKLDVRKGDRVELSESKVEFSLNLLLDSNGFEDKLTMENCNRSIWAKDLKKNFSFLDIQQTKENRKENSWTSFHVEMTYAIRKNTLTIGCCAVWRCSSRISFRIPKRLRNFF